MDRYLSEKLRVLSLVAIVMVMLQHAYCLSPGPVPAEFGGNGGSLAPDVFFEIFM